MGTDNTELEVQNVNPADGKTYYKPTILKVGGTSQYRDTEFFFGNVAGYWDSSHAKGDGLTIGSWVKVALSTKEKPGGPNTKPGSLYRDIVQVRPATPGEIPANGNQPPVRNDGEPIYRTKEELRWTEALHMATAYDNTNPQVVNENAHWFYQLLEHGPGATESHADEPFDDAPIPEQDDLPF